MNNVPCTWRLIKDGTASGSFNMAVDEAILRARKTEEVPSTIRFYSWDKKYISVGYFQQLTPDIVSFCQQHDIGLVRRLTGGGCVLHDEEVTVSIIFSKKEIRHLLASSEYYRIISECVQTALAGVGVKTQLYMGESSLSASSYFCFNQPAKYDVMVSDKKIFGSAQFRSQDIILQQGTLRMKRGAYAEFGERASSLADAIADLPAPKNNLAIYDILAKGFEQRLQIRFMPDTLTGNEKQLAEQLQYEKYAINPAPLFSVPLCQQ